MIEPPSREEVYRLIARAFAGAGECYAALKELATAQRRPDGERHPAVSAEHAVVDMAEEMEEVVINLQQYLLELSPPGEPRAASNPFHAHLDVCVQCRKEPFNLCPAGAAALLAAVGAGP